MKKKIRARFGRRCSRVDEVCVTVGSVSVVKTIRKSVWRDVDSSSRPTSELKISFDSVRVSDFFTIVSCSAMIIIHQQLVLAVHFVQAPLAFHCCCESDFKSGKRQICIRQKLFSCRWRPMSSADYFQCFDCNELREKHFSVGRFTARQANLLFALLTSIDALQG